ncbi:AlpA family phage regulatory protein [Skermanella sp. TT6]|uniref:AlpA family phage regulatory protein n=1 Tax=Skermanella cutis TaxID=2775420 RepID=A0ABX7B1E7_9PROT|nr:AlpA family phage regulatory protein [Skermanella sp. TT6]QQP88145.1 AlpA family phage regulatory protein [Skermanella sp. TT6]
MDDRTTQPSFPKGGVSPMPSAVPKLVTAKELSAKIPYSAVHVWRLEQKGEFPRRIHLGCNRVAWLEAEILEWLARKLAEREAAALTREAA